MINSGRFGIYLVKKNYHSLPDEALKYMFIKILDVNNTVSQLLLNKKFYFHYDTSMDPASDMCPPYNNN